MSTTGPITIGIDVGSHGVRAVALAGDVVVDGAARYVGALPPVRRPFPVVVDALTRAVTALPARLRAAAVAVCVTGVRGSVVGFEGSGPVTAVVPDFDEPTLHAALALRDRYGDALSVRTGCPAFPLSGLPKIAALHPVHPRAVWVSVPDAVAWQLTGELACSTGSALRLGLLNRAATAYDTELLREMSLPEGVLAPLRPVGSTVGVGGRFAQTVGLPPSVPVVAGPGDGPAALVAARRDPDLVDPAFALVSLGTSTVVSAPVDDTLRMPVPPGFTLEVLDGDRRSIETGDGGGMANVDWAAALLGVAPEDLDSMAARGVVADTLTVDLPAMDVWGHRGTGSITGFPRGFGRDDLARAVLDFVADSAAAAVRRVAAVTDVRELVLTGGGARSAYLCAAIAARTTVSTTHRRERELPALGAAYVAREAAA